MKRSEINKIIRDMENMISNQGLYLPPFAYWDVEKWEQAGHDFDEIRDNKLGWDITDYGLNDFFKVGFALFTLRNGNVKDSRYKKTYAEKLLMLYPGQSSPMHYHWNKMEDIINRGGGEVFISVYNGNNEKEKLDTEVKISKDGREYYVSAGTEIILKPGESITIYPYMYHDFKVKGNNAILLGEVSMCNDDENDNCFFDDVGRFPEIEEDEPPYHLLCNEYPVNK